MYKRNEILECFNVYKRDTDFRLNLGLPDSVVERSDIAGREESTKKSLNFSSFEEIDSAQGTTNFEQMKNLLNQLKAFKLLPQLSGLGLELGSGIGILSCAILEQDSDELVEGVLALEAVPSFVQEGIPKAGRELLKERCYQLLPSFGTFEKIDIEEGSLDFVIQIESLHHAQDLNTAASEACRILKPGGFMLSIDRSWPDSVSDIFLNSLLDHKYEEGWLEKRGFPRDKIKTRRDNGEHEYRDCEWRSVFERVGFVEEFFIPFHPRLKFWNVAKRILGVMGMSQLFNAPARSGLMRGLICHVFHLNPIRFGGIPITNHPRALTYMLYKKS